MLFDWLVAGHALEVNPAHDIQPSRASKLQTYTKTVFKNFPYRDSLLQKAGIEKGNPVPDTPGGPTPIKHLILLMKENRTYDQVLGDMKEGNGDPNLVLFGEKITPNYYRHA